MKPATIETTVLKRSVVLGRGKDRHKTSVSMEDAFWREVHAAAKRRELSVADFITAVNKERRVGNLSSCLRLLMLEEVREHG
jgi:predicted DNA-binding ribbon-helix-helix protein